MFKKLQDEVKEIMTENKQCCNSDELLYCEYLSRHGVKSTFLRLVADLINKGQISSFESVSRARRHIASLNEELISERTKQRRAKLEEKYRSAYGHRKNKDAPTDEELDDLFRDEDEN